jgi:Ca2+-binding RTX toxin-like protein
LSALPGQNDILPPSASLSGTLESYENINGTSGNDVLTAGGGYLDTLIGQGGDDSYIIESESTRIKEYYNGGNDTVYSYASTLSTSANVETFYMMYGALSLTGSGHDNTIFGNKHDNTINGRNGNDILAGYEGDDVLIGGGGNDTAVFQGNLADFDIVWLGGTDLEVSDIAGGGQGTDSLTQIEFLEFNDGTVDAAGFFV